MISEFSANIADKSKAFKTFIFGYSFTFMHFPSISALDSWTEKCLNGE